MAERTTKSFGAIFMLQFITIAHLVIPRQVNSP